MIAAEGLGASDCEALRAGLFAQPVNALTSAGYIVAGGIVWLRLPRDQRVGWGGAYALLLALVGVGSVLYHGPQVSGSQLMHDAPIPALLALIGVLVLVRLVRKTPALPGWNRTVGFALGGLAALAGLSYWFGRTGSPLCDPESPWQPHGLWHLCTAAAFVLVAEMLFGGPEARPAQ